MNAPGQTEQRAASCGPYRTSAGEPALREEVPCESLAWQMREYDRIDARRWAAAAPAGGAAAAALWSVWAALIGTGVWGHEPYWYWYWWLCVWGAPWALAVALVAAAHRDMVAWRRARREHVRFVLQMQEDVRRGELQFTPLCGRAASRCGTCPRTEPDTARELRGPALRGSRLWGGRCGR